MYEYIYIHTQYIHTNTHTGISHRGEHTGMIKKRETGYEKDARVYHKKQGEGHKNMAKAFGSLMMNSARNADGSMKVWMCMHVYACVCVCVYSCKVHPCLFIDCECRGRGGKEKEK
jgi:hypothetical protein